MEQSTELDQWRKKMNPINEVATSFMDVFNNIIDVKTYLVSKSRTIPAIFKSIINSSKDVAFRCFPYIDALLHMLLFALLKNCC